MKSVAATLRKASRGKGAVKLYEFPLPDQLIGLEVEVDAPENFEEGQRFSWPEQYAPYWRKERDGSLRNGNEYVLAAPLNGNMLSNAICKLFDGGTSIYRTTTGSTHIHVDMLEDDTSIASVQVLVLLMFMLEPAVFAACDPGREWCGFTNKLSSAPDSLLGAVLNCDLSESPDKFIDAIAGHTAVGIGRYYGLNLQALHKYGSVEFRYFPTATSADELASWVTLVQMFKKAAIDIGSVTNLQEIVENESRYTDFIATYFAPWIDFFMKEVPHYKAVGSFQKALATAASQQCRASNSRWSDEFDPRAITDSKMYSKLVKKRKKDANVRAQLELLVMADDESAPNPVAEGPLLVSGGRLYVPMPSSINSSRITWANVDVHSSATLEGRLPTEYMRRVLATIIGARYSLPMQVSSTYQLRIGQSCTHAIDIFTRCIQRAERQQTGAAAV